MQPQRRLHSPHHLQQQQQQQQPDWLSLMPRMPAPGSASALPQRAAPAPPLPLFDASHAAQRFAALATASRLSAKAAATGKTLRPSKTATADGDASTTSQRLAASPETTDDAAVALADALPPPPSINTADPDLEATPTRRILEASDMPAWLRSEALARYLDFVQLVAAAVRGHKNVTTTTGVEVPEVR
ncbi:hypothetical protein HK405_002478 [Cladochytrium tenue]|nr:hypothetical protein HK405_002478 [Cladochytrium tenue]